MKKRDLKHNRSGQVIIITALLVTSLLLSTAIYVIETEKGVPTVGTNENNVLTQYTQSTKSTLISALANITNDGATSVLTSDLSELNNAITSHSYQSMLQMGFTPLNVAPYQNGVWISWGTNGRGISSTYVGFVFNSSASSTTISLGYDVNITSETDLSGNYQQINDTSKQVNLVVNLLNEGKPALAQNFIFYIRNAAEAWVTVDSPGITNFGNGTYIASFISASDSSSTSPTVSMLCQDQRGIYVGANVTCTNMR